MDQKNKEHQDTGAPADPQEGHAVVEEDAEGEPPVPAEEGAQANEKSVVAALEEKNQALQDKYMRVLADMENMRKRHEQECQNIRKHGTTALLKNILSVMDNVTRALTTPVGDAPDPMVKGLFEGLTMIQAELTAFLKKQGVTKIEALGAPFDTAFHQAIREDISEKDPGTVVDVMQEGYLLGDRLLRPAAVVIAKKEDHA
ncbi:nucleotide exchange factor GrpE [Candidatus Hepatobacter penaei]|uniref:nucleotide exchange factor GrpE n=1 Tax=Candidatus Hepatobacter penaei TaxID=1274402 RepID=UPI0006977844|nr:nucleotide exchange factor GrpE [Candidatus Hepatobacter penaei]TGW15208.1 nucleotide exchange factor GrpE [bacterium NHP-B]